MPVIHRQRLAARLRQNWSTMYPTETNQTPTTAFQMIDDSLTSLAWLQNLNIMRLSSNSSSSSSSSSSSQRSAVLHSTAAEDKAAHTIDPVAPPRCTLIDRCFYEDDAASAAALSRLPVDPNDILDMSGKHSPTSPPSPAAAAAVAEETGAVAASRVDDGYKYDASIKPPYSYAILICMAMQEKPDRRITLSQIYNWIADNFAYYRQADQNWQHSIRHNLSLNKCFQKIPRGKDEPGKGGFWTINPEFYSLVDRGIFKKRRPSAFGENFVKAAVHAFKKEPNGIEEVTPSPTEASNCCCNTEQPPPQKKDERASQGHTVSPPDPFWSFGTDSLTDTLSASWSNVFNQDIDVGGISVKTADILVDLETTAAVGSIARSSPSLESPLPSSVEDNDSDLDMEALLCSAYPPSVDPVAPRSGDPLDLTIHGIGLQPPDWWSESLNGHFPVGGEDGLFSASSAPHLQPTRDGHMHTPLTMPFHEDDDNFHPWAEDRDALIGFDAGSVLLDTENIDSFKLF